MAYLLLGIAGPVIGMVQRLDSEPLTMGRDSSSSLPLPDAAVSRKHCTLEPDAAGVRLTDTGSFNGTFVNGARTREALLVHGDEIRMGACVFRILDERLDSDPASGRSPSGGTATLRTARLAGDSGSPFELERLARRLHRQERYRVELAALLELASALPPLTVFAEARRCFFEILFRTLPVESAVLVMMDPASGLPAAAFGWRRGAGPAPPERIPEQALARCVEGPDGDSIHLDNCARRLFALPCDAGVSGVLALEMAAGKGLDPHHCDWLRVAVRIAGGLLHALHELERLRKANRQLSSELEGRCLIVGDTPAIEAVKRQILKAAPSDATVLITGETGSGKEPVARAIHAASPRAGGPFVPVNCAALSTTLLESDLFGHERGAFTGAVALKRGRIEAAAGGTLFLDEIGELDPAIQARLLRVLQDREFERVGGTVRHRADIRLVAATNRNLAHEVERGAFRKDLYYRIHVIAIHVPPLRERRADIPLLAAHFLSTSSVPSARRIRGISPQARRRLMAYDWPGNVRELQNAIEHAIVFCQGDRIEEQDLPETLLEAAGDDAASSEGYYAMLREAKRRILLAALAASGGSQQEAARTLGLNPSHLSRLIRTLGLRPEAGSFR